MPTIPKKARSADRKKKPLVYRLKLLRRLLGLSQTDVAKRAGISLRQERHLENLRVFPRFIEARARLARVFDTSIWGIFSSRTRKRFREGASGNETAQEADVFNPACAVAACYRSPYLMIVPMYGETAGLVVSRRLHDRSEIPTTLECVVADLGCSTVVVEPDVKKLCVSQKFSYDLHALSVSEAKHILLPEAALITHDQLVRSIGPACPFLAEQLAALPATSKLYLTQPWLIRKALPFAMGLAYYKSKAGDHEPKTPAN